MDDREVSECTGGELYCEADTELHTDDVFVNRFAHGFIPMVECGTVNAKSKLVSHV